MRKILKKAYVFLCMMIMLVSAMPMMAFAEETKETRIAVNMKVPQDWKDPCIWAWNDDGKNAFDAWPGGECDVREDNAGWYYAWIPNWANHVIINANDGSVQTAELKLEGKDAWVTVESAEKADVSYTAQTTGTTPEYVEKFAVHAKVDDSWTNPGLWAWSAPDGKNAFKTWPGKAMKKGENGWYTAYAPVFVNSIIINANEGGVQTEDIAIDAAEVWVTVAADGKAEFSYKDPDKAEVANITVHVKAPADWANPNLWAWSAPDGTNVFTSWPGEPLEEKDGWLVKEIPGWVNSVIVNGNDGSVQTSDLSIETGKDIWVVINGPEDAVVSYEEPKVDEVRTESGVAQQEETKQAGENKDKGLNPAIPIGIAAALAIVVVVVVLVVKKRK